VNRLALVFGFVLVTDRFATAEPLCRVLDVSLAPASLGAERELPPQIVAWLEDAQGTFVETIYITQATGSFGIGNRPGRFDFNSGPLWPYGRRTTTFPIWSNKQPLRWPALVFQDNRDNDLSHFDSQSSTEAHFCRPTIGAELDAITCPTSRVKTDKGVMSTSQTSTYPPRNDLVRIAHDAASVEMFEPLNPFDAISQPTPIFGADAQISYAVPAALPAGDYVLWVEVSKELDFNATYNPTTFPPPRISFAMYGEPYRGQPSVVYRLPITLGVADALAMTVDYAGYGDPEGADGAIRPPDATIEVATGTGGGRLALLSSGGQLYRVRGAARTETDAVPPDAPRETSVVTANAFDATIGWLAPGDDGALGSVKGYELRYRINEVITEENFATSPQVTTGFALVPTGTEQQIVIPGLLPETEYSIGVRAFDNCGNASPLAIIPLTTSARESGSVDACFIATAAYGSVMAQDVALLRGFRNAVLARTPLGELAIEAYYTFSPAISGLIGESELLRATTRRALGPVVDAVRATAR
jgi:hypothetical protein